jgi:hypothetical protein
MNHRKGSMSAQHARVGLACKRGRAKHESEEKKWQESGKGAGAAVRSRLNREGVHLEGLPKRRSAFRTKAVAPQVERRECLVRLRKGQPERSRLEGGYRGDTFWSVSGRGREMTQVEHASGQTAQEQVESKHASRNASRVRTGIERNGRKEKTR